MKIILKDDVPKLGKAWAVVNVSDGYARNYLIPRGLAVEATKGALKRLNQMKKSAAQRQSEEKAEAEEIKEKLSGLTLEFTAKAGENGKLFGSITDRDIADELKQRGITVDKKKIVLDDPLRSLGEYDITVKLQSGVEGTVHVKIRAEE